MKPPYIPPNEAGACKSLLDLENLSPAARAELARTQEHREQRGITRDILIAAYQEGYLTPKVLLECAERAFKPLPPRERQIWLGYVVETELSKPPKERPSPNGRAKRRPPLSPRIRELASELLWGVMTYEKVSRKEANTRVVEILKERTGLIVGARTIERLTPKKPRRQNSK